MNTKSIILIVIALVCGLVASVAVHQVMSSGGDAQNQVKSVKVVMATGAIDINEQLTKENIGLKDWPADRVPEGAVLKLEDAIENFAATRFYKGEPVLAAKISSAINGAQDVPDGFRVAPIKVQKDAMTDLIKPGDKVDVSVFLKASNGQPPQVKTILTALKIYSVNNRTDRVTPEGDEGKTSAIKSMTALAKAEHADLLSLAMEVGKIRLLLRSPTDTTANQTKMVTDQNALLAAAGISADDPEPVVAKDATADSEGETTGESFKDWLNEMKEEQVAITPSVKDRKPKTEFSMIVHAGDGTRMKYEWVNKGELPQEVAGNAPASAPAIPEGDSKPGAPQTDDSGNTDSTDESSQEGSIDKQSQATAA